MDEIPMIDEAFDDGMEVSGVYNPATGQWDEPDEQVWQFLALSRWGDKRMNAAL